MIRKYTHKVSIAPQPTPPEPVTTELEQLQAQLLAMEFDAVAAYAKEKGIDIGNVTTVKGAVGKIMAALPVE